jgi:(E)-4-hydroxy-3-methyl-but-2-enyl pyrophosphate reductase
MKIIVARTAGFCMGVRRVVDLALEHTSSDTRLFTLGPVIHNSAALEMLRNRGAAEIDAQNPPPAGARVLIRAHGVPPHTQETYARGYEIVDGTCPKVKTVHKVIEKYRGLGYGIIIAGDKGHAEVVGLQGYAGDAGRLIQTVVDVDRLPLLEKVCLVSQTTFDKRVFDEIAERVRARYAGREVVVKKTICSATEQRQEETRSLARQADGMVVVGGADSANTLRLAKIAAESCPIVEHVETELDIRWEPFSRCRSIGVTAGASTPHWMIKRVVDHLQFLADAQEHTARSLVHRTLDLCGHLNVFLALGAAALYYASCVLQGMAFRPTGALLAFLYFLSMYLWNSLGSIELTQHLGLRRYRFYRTHKRGLFALAGVCIAALLAVSYLDNRTLFYLMLFCTFVGSVYHITIVPRFLRPILRYSNLRDVPTSRDLFAALAWGVLLTFIPHAIDQQLTVSPATALCFVWVFSLAYLRSVISDLRDIEGDRIMGRETLVTIIGERRAHQAILLWMRTLLVIVVAYSATVLVGSHGPASDAFTFVLQLPVLLYIYLFERRNRAVGVSRSWFFSLLADGHFLLAGALAGVADVLVSAWNPFAC